MSAISGAKGLVTYKGVPVLRINQWSGDISNNTLEVTTWTTGTDLWRENISGLNQLSGSMSGMWDAKDGGSTAQRDLQTNLLTPATGTIQLYMDKDGGEHFSFDTVLSRQSIGVSIDAANTISFDFVSNGPVTFSTTT